MLLDFLPSYEDSMRYQRCSCSSEKPRLSVIGGAAAKGVIIYEKVTKKWKHQAATNRAVPGGGAERKILANKNNNQNSFARLSIKEY